MMSGSPGENWTYFLLVTGVTSLLLFNFGWFREQFCIIMCPYGRFQNVLMDQQSQNVVYHHARGEPRKGVAPSAPRQGDCVSCNRCVQVCPTGIDIRNGLQMECISCSACIDACDEIMTKLKKPTGLIFYGLDAPGVKPRYFRPRIIAYLALVFVISSVLIYTLANRLPYSVAVLRAKDTPYQVSAEGLVINHFKAHVMNQSKDLQTLHFTLPPEFVDLGIKITQAQSTHELKIGESREVHLFVSFPRTVLDSSGNVRLRLQVREASRSEVRSIEIVGVGPYSSGS